MKPPPIDGKVGGIGSLIAKVASGMLSISILGAGVALLCQVLLARLLGAEEYGWYVLILAWVQILIVPSVCGFDTAVLRCTSTAVAEKDWSHLRGLLSFSFLMVLAISAFVALITGLVVEYGPLGWGADRKFAMLVALALIPIMSLTPVASEALRGLKKILLASTITKILRPALLLVVVILMSQHFTVGLQALDVIAVNVIAAILALIILTASLGRSLPAGVFRSSPSYTPAHWFNIAFPMVFMSAMYMILAKIDIIMLGKFSGAANAGVYAATGRLTEIVGFGLAAVNSIAAPMLAEHFSKKDFSKLQLTLSWSARLALVFTLFASIALWFIGEFVLSWFGEEFVRGHVALRVLLIGSIASSFAGPVGYMLTMAGEQKIAALVVGATAVLNIAMNLILIPRYGLVGAAAATSISTVACNLSMFVIVRAKWKLNSSALGRVKGLQ